MFYLILAVACSSLISIFMRMGESKISSRGGMFIANYLVCIALARAFVGKVQLFTLQEGSGLAIGLGTVCGILFLLNFLLLQLNISRNGMVLSSIFMKLGVVIPVLVAIVAFKEVPSIWQVAGILIAIASIVLINYEKNGADASKSSSASKWLLIVLLLGGGITDSMMNIYDKLGAPALANNYLFYVFFAALICAVIMQLIQRSAICKWDIIYGAAIGIPNYFASKFQLAALKTVPAVIVFPVYSVGAIALISLVGVLLFKEKLDKNKFIAIAMAILALVLLNI